MSVHRERLARVIFATDSKAGKSFDVLLLVAILASVLVVLLESVQPIHEVWGTELFNAEVLFTGLFTGEYLLRIWCSPKPRRYMRSFFGVIDLASILPTYLSLFVPGMQSLMVIRAVRVLRVFHIFNLKAYLAEENMLAKAFKASVPKIVVFLVVIANVIVIVGALMYVVEGPAAGFTSVPRGVYWAVVTISTVGFGDITPVTGLGQAIAAVLMMLGYCLIIVPTALVSVELAQGVSRETQINRCGTCGQLEHRGEATFCHRCGQNLHAGHLNSPSGT